MKTTHCHFEPAKQARQSMQLKNWIATATSWPRNDDPWVQESNQISI